MAERAVAKFHGKRWPLVTVPALAAIGVVAGAALAQKPPEAFVVVPARDAVIDFVHRNGGSGAKEMIETMGSGVAIADFDNDGLPDIFFVNGAAVPSLKKESASFSNRLYRNVGGFRFVDVTERAGLAGSGYGMGVAVGDYNNDGFEDLYVTGFGHNQLFRNRGDGTFEDVTSRAGVGGGGWSTSAAFVDYDRDGFLDLAVARYVRYTVGTGPYCGDKSRGWRSYCLPDQFLPSSLVLYHNNGDGTFSDTTEKAGLGGVKVNGLGIRILDVDGDGWPDIVVASDRTQNLLFHNVHGRFEEIGTTAGLGYSNDGVARAGMGIDAADVDGDGRPDIAIANFESEGTALLMNQGGLSFRDEAGSRGLLEPTFPFVGFGLRFFDFDNDGMPDLMVANGHVLDDIARYRHDMTWAQPVLLLHNNQGKFVPAPVHGADGQPLRLVGRGLATGDLTNSGRVDVVITQNDGPPILLRNRGGQGNHSILLRIIGTRSNRDGFGTRVAATIDGRIWTSEVTASGSYLSSSDPRVLIGMGPSRQVQNLKLNWPSGIRQEIRGLEAGYLYTIRERQGVTRPEAAKKLNP
jgi:hypothetical protein